MASFDALEDCVKEEVGSIVLTALEFGEELDREELSADDDAAVANVSRVGVDVDVSVTGGELLL